MKNRPCDPHVYFDPTPSSKIVPIQNLVRDHVPSEEKLKTAIYRMERAARGLHPKRHPVSVKLRQDGKYLVVDGNTTTTVLMDWGCTHLIAQIVD